MSGEKKKRFIRYTPEELAAVPSPHQRDLERESRPTDSLVKDAGIGAIAGAVVGTVLGVPPGTGAVIGGAAGVANNVTKKR